MRKILCLVFVISTTYCFSQQATQYTMYMLNPFQFNPAYAGLDNAIMLTGVYRNQWQGLNQSPEYQNVNFHLPIYRFSSGIGINFENDELGGEQNLKATFAYNYQLPIGRSSVLALGISAGFFQKTINGADIRTPDGIYTDGIIQHNDDLPLPTSEINASTTTFNAGVYFKSETFEVGLSTVNLQEPTLESDFLNTQLTRNYFLSISYNFDLLQNVSLHPSVLVKTDQTEWQTDISALFKYKDNIFLGGSFRGYNSSTIDAAALILGGNVSQNIRIAYSYDFTLSDVNLVSNGSHEVLLSINLGTEVGKGKLPKIILNPRYLE